MPDKDGYEVCTQLKLGAETQGIPVIFLTADRHMSGRSARGFDVGAVDYVHKPFSPAIVKARVQTHLVLRGIRRTTGKTVDRDPEGIGNSAANPIVDSFIRGSRRSRVWTSPHATSP